MPAADQRSTWNLSSYVATIPVGGGQPYDALCEWIYASGDAYIDTGLNLSSAPDTAYSAIQLSVYADISTDIPCDISQTSSLYPLFGVGNSVRICLPYLGIGRDFITAGVTRNIFNTPGNGSGGMLELSGDLSAYKSAYSFAWNPGMPTVRIGFETDGAGATRCTLYNYRVRPNWYDYLYNYGGFRIRNTYNTIYTATTAMKPLPLDIFRAQQGNTVEYGSTPALKLMRFELWFMTTDGLKHMLLVPARKGG